MAPDGNEADGTVRIWRNARLATLSPSLPGMGVVENGAVVTQGGRIALRRAGCGPACKHRRVGGGH